MATKTRKERREELWAANKQKLQQIATTTRPGTQAEIMAAVKKTNLQYLWGSEPIAFTLTAESRSDVCCNSVQGSVILPAGTRGWVYQSVERLYDSYTRIDDWEVPAAGAKVVKETRYYTFCCLVEVEGVSRVAHSFKTVENEHQ